MYFHSPIEFRLIKYTAPELGRLIPQVERKKAAPAVHKTLPELSTPQGRRGSVRPVPPANKQIEEHYRRDHDQLAQLELHHAYRQVRNLWDRQQFHPERRPLHIGVGRDGHSTSQAALQSARFLAGHYHSHVTELASWQDGRGKLLLPETPHAFSLLILPRTEGVALADIIAQAPCSVLIQCGDKPLQQLKNILVPADGTAFCYPALAQGFMCCEDFGSELSVMHVATEPAQKTIEHHDLTQRLGQLAWHAVGHDVVTVVGDVVQQILAYADTTATDLIIMGTHRKAQERHESLTLQLIKNSRVPVWVPNITP